ncbi:MAG: hypothetical protein K6G15_01050 [Desulfovibrio sp.]|nr:hypothetical protein [Desulfovibrio sp.]
MKKALLEQLREWAETPFSNPTVRFEDTYLDNGFCVDCRLCCGPQPGDDPYPMALLDSQLGPKNAEDFYLLDAHTACLDERGCKALGTSGCTLPRHRRPVACGLFPLVLQDGALYLYRICPASLLIPMVNWLALGQKALAYLAKLPLKDQKRLSIHLPESVLLERYSPLYLNLFAK